MTDRCTMVKQSELSFQKYNALEVSSYSIAGFAGISITFGVGACVGQSKWWSLLEFEGKSGHINQQ